MKLRNKKTGEILGSLGSFIIQNPNGINCEAITKYDSLAELNEEWEDAPEEPKEYWYIDYDGGILCREYNDLSAEKMMISMGNHFDSLEEAEETVERLRAWKRLRDKGFRFDGYDSGHNSNKELCGQAYFKAGNFWFDIKTDLDLLFGGEE